jgi:hypothetical protein
MPRRGRREEVAARARSASARPWGESRVAWPRLCRPRVIAGGLASAWALHQRTDPHGDVLRQPWDGEDRRDGDKYGSRGREYRPQPTASPARSRCGTADFTAPTIEAMAGSTDLTAGSGWQHGFEGDNDEPQIGQPGPEARGDRSQPVTEQPGAEAVPRWPMGDPMADPLQAIPGRHDAVCRRVQRAAQAFAVFSFRFRHDSCSSTVRSADVPCAV